MNRHRLKGSDMLFLQGDIYDVDARFQAAVETALKPPEKPSAEQLSMLDANSDIRPTLITDMPNAAGVSVIRVQGVLLRGSRYWYSNTWDILHADLQFLAARPGVTGIVLAIDSPGGVYQGCQEVCDLLDQISIPVVAWVSGNALSAAYRIACHCGQIFATPSSDIGNIGSTINLVDYSKQYQQEGLEVVSVNSGAYKTLGLMGTEITPEQRAFLQTRVERMQAGFMASLEKRGITGAKATQVADGRWWDATEAEQLGLIDGIRTIRQVVDEMVSSGSQNVRAAARQEGSMTGLVSGQPAVGAGQSGAAAVAGTQQAAAAQSQPAGQQSQPAQQAAPAQAAQIAPQGEQAVAQAAVTQPAGSAQQAVTIDQIEQLCPGADPSFILQQAKVPGNTEVGVLRAFAVYQQQQIAALQSSSAVDRVVQTAPAGSNNLSQAPASGQQAGSTDVIGQFEQLVEEHVKGGMTRQSAVQQVCVEQPGLQQQYQAAIRNLTPTQVAARRSKNCSRVLGRGFVPLNQ